MGEIIRSIKFSLCNRSIKLDLNNDQHKLKNLINDSNSEWRNVYSSLFTSESAVKILCLFTLG